MLSVTIASQQLRQPRLLVHEDVVFCSPNRAADCAFLTVMANQKRGQSPLLVRQRLCCANRRPRWDPPFGSDGQLEEGNHRRLAIIAIQ